MTDLLNSIQSNLMAAGLIIGVIGLIWAGITIMFKKDIREGLTRAVAPAAGLFVIGIAVTIAGAVAKASGGITG